MDNHVHILLRSVSFCLPMFMRRLLWDAIFHNRRHGRYCHLFQNRYKSIVCEEDPYFMELVRYIHLNPLRAGSRKQPLPKIRKQLSAKFVGEYGLLLAETARQLGISTSAIAQIIRRGRKV